MSDPGAQDYTTDSVGHILRARRREQDLSAQEVATQLHLDPRVIEALENDAFDQLPASIYVRGYIRNYAKLVGADGEHLVRLYDQAGAEEEPEIIPEVRHPTQTSSSDKPVKVVTYLITLVLVILLVAWWQSNFLISQPGTPAANDSNWQHACGEISHLRQPTRFYFLPASHSQMKPLIPATSEAPRMPVLASTSMSG